MAGKLLYSRILQNRLAKQQNGQDGQPADPQASSPRPQQNYYSSNAPAQGGHDDYGVGQRRSYYDNNSGHNASGHNAGHNSGHYNNGGYNDDRFDKGDAGNKVRRGPGRRIAKEKRLRSMDPALLQKYSSLSESLQEKVNATIEICYQQHMANLYRNPGKLEDDTNHYEQDVEFDADTALDTGEI